MLRLSMSFNLAIHLPLRWIAALLYLLKRCRFYNLPVGWSPPEAKKRILPFPSQFHTLFKPGPRPSRFRWLSRSHLAFWVGGLLVPQMR